jgi:hypothetical protein
MNETLTGRAKQDVWLETPRLPTAEDGAAVYYSLFNETACGN